MKTLIDVACPKCDQQVGEPCRSELLPDGWHDVLVDSFHSERKDAADFINAVESGQDISFVQNALEKQAIDKVAEDEVL